MWEVISTHEDVKESDPQALALLTDHGKIMFLEHHIHWEPLITLRKKKVRKLGREKVPYHKVKQ